MGRKGSHILQLPASNGGVRERAQGLIKRTVNTVHAKERLEEANPGWKRREGS